jgi:hypothetical protein
MEMPPWKDSSPLGRASLGLGIASIALVFGIGLCAIVGANQGWLGLLAVPLYVCGASSAFLGLIAVLLSGAGLLGKQQPRSVLFIGLALGSGGMCLFAFVLQAVGGG